jgi:hypothetical protein
MTWKQSIEKEKYSWRNEKDVSRQIIRFVKDFQTKEKNVSQKELDNCILKNK